MPLHVAVAARRSPDVIRFLVRVHPDGVREADDRGNLPVNLMQGGELARVLTGGSESEADAETGGAEESWTKLAERLQGGEAGDIADGELERLIETLGDITDEAKLDAARKQYAKGKAAGRCANCDAEGATRKCTQCRAVVYCDEKCQKVRDVETSRVTRRHSRRALTPCCGPPPAPRRCTGVTAATRRPARPTCSPTPSTRSTSGCAGRRWRPIVA